MQIVDKIKNEKEKGEIILSKFNMKSLLMIEISGEKLGDDILAQNNEWLHFVLPKYRAYNEKIAPIDTVYLAVEIMNKLLD